MPIHLSAVSDLSAGSTVAPVGVTVLMNESLNHSLNQFFFETPPLMRVVQRLMQSALALFETIFLMEQK